MRGLRVVSLFSGAGGLDLGLIQAGHTVVWANDFDADSVATYRRNLGDHITCDDISRIGTVGLPQSDVVVGGFPCQGFSMANRHRSIDDDRNGLYRQFIRIVRGVKPAMFLAENVRGILSLDNGNAIKRIVQAFHSAGYAVSYKLLNAADYGVPQTRQRVVIAGVRRDLAPVVRFQFPAQTHARQVTSGSSLKPWVSIESALQGVPEPGTGHLKNHICSAYKVTNRNFTGHRRTDPSKPSPTILARGNGGGGVCAIQHPGNHRRMSVRESAIIQTFPRSFVFEGGLNSMYRQVGNAVPVVLAKRLGESLSRAFGAAPAAVLCA